MCHSLVVSWLFSWRQGALKLSYKLCGQLNEGQVYTWPCPWLLGQREWDHTMLFFEVLHTQFSAMACCTPWSCQASQESWNLLLTVFSVNSASEIYLTCWYLLTVTLVYPSKQDKRSPSLIFGYYHSFLPLSSYSAKPSYMQGFLPSCTLRWSSSLLCFPAALDRREDHGRT